MKLRHLTLALLFALCLSRCTAESGRDGIPVQLDFQIGTRAATEPGSAYENTITKIRVMVFHRATGIIDANGYDVNPGGFDPLPINMTLTVLSGNKTFCVIANEPDAMTPTLELITSIDDLKALTIGDVLNTGDPLPMALIHEEYVDPYRQSSDPVRLGLERSVGKVRMGVVKDVGNTYPVTLKSVKVINAATESRLMPGNQLAPPAMDDLVAETFNDPVTVSTPVQMTSLYLYERYWGKSSIDLAIAAGAATSLEVTVEIDRSPANPPIQTLTAKIPLAGAFDNAESIYAVFRNTIADITATVYGDALIVNYTVLPWEDAGEYEKAVGEEDRNYFVLPWEDGGEYDHKLE